MAIERTPGGAPVWQTCGRRKEHFDQGRYAELQDNWRIEANGDRTCSFCGSLHHDDFYRLVVESLNDGSKVRIEPSDKPYKVYVHRSEVRNASEGGIKFYKQHDRLWTAEQRAEIIRIWSDVIGKSNIRFEDYMRTFQKNFPAPDPPEKT